MMVRDPICGMMVDDATAIEATRDGRRYHFCCEHCRKKLLALKPDEFERLLKEPVAGAARSISFRRPSSTVAAHSASDDPKAATGQGVPTGMEFTCPMHPEIRQDHPG